LLWYIQVRNGEIESFYDVGDGINRYGIPISMSPHVQVPLSKESSILRELSNYVPETATIAYFRAIAVFPRGERRKAMREVSIWYGPNGSGLASSTHPIAGIDAKHPVTFNGAIPLVSAPNFDVVVRYSGPGPSAKPAPTSNLIFQNPGVAIYFTGWKLDRKYE
jgi:hypothetical protein